MRGATWVSPHHLAGGILGLRLLHLLLHGYALPLLHLLLARIRHLLVGYFQPFSIYSLIHSVLLLLQVLLLGLLRGPRGIPVGAGLRGGEDIVLDRIPLLLHLGRRDVVP